MQNQSIAKRITITALFLALGLILPYFTAHAFGIPGNIFLPMHLPILLAGFICGPASGAMLGIIVPLLSSVLTGMPPMYPMLPIMAAQLFALGLLSGVLYKKLNLPLFLSLILSVVAGWIVYGLMFAFLMLVSGGALKALSMTAAIAQGLPGIAIQLILVPLLLAAIERYNVQSGTGTPPASKAVTKAQRLVKTRQATVAVVQDNQIVYQAKGKGISPILQLYHIHPELLKDAYVADKIVGKAAAMIFTLGGVKHVYGEVMSWHGREYLENQSIRVNYGRCVDVIAADNSTGICPIERSVLDIEDAQEGIHVLEGALAELSGAMSS